MKHSILACFFLLFTLSFNASARSIPLAKGGSVAVPDQVIVSPEGITFVRPGTPAPFTLPWQAIDLVKLARLDTELEASRQKALLTGEKTLLSTDSAKPNPYAEFLNQPLKVTFRPKETHQTKVESTSVSTAIPSPEFPPGQALNTPFPPAPQRVVNNATTTRSDTTVNLTRQPLDTTIGGFLELISDSSQSASGNLIRELREQPHVFTNLLNELRSLQTQVSNDPVLAATVEALQKLAKIGPVSIDAQRALARYLVQIRSRAEDR